MKKLLLIFMTLVTCLTVSVANADVLGFDTITADPFTNNLGGYGGLNWDTFGVGDGTRMIDLPNGYVNGTVSGSYVAYNWNAGMATVSNSNGTFDFIGAYLTGAWNNGLNIDVVGYSGGSQIYSQTVVVNTGGPTWFQLDYTGVDTVTFDSYGGTNAGLSSSGTHFAMDDFTYNTVVPEPISSTLFIVGGATLGLRQWRKKRRTA